MNIVDQLVVKLGLDSKEFKRGVADVDDSLDKARKGTEKTAKQMKDSGKDAATFFGELQKSALKFMAALAAGRGLYNFVQNTIKGGASLQRLATNLQTNADSLHRWGQAVKQNGGTVEGFQATIQNLSAGVTELMRGGNENLRGFLSTLGIGLQDASGKAKTMEQILLDVASAVEEGKLGPSRANQVNFLQQMGLDDGTINLLLKGRKEVEKALAAQTGYNESDAKKALEYEQKWLQAQEKINGYMREITYKLLPSLIPAIDAIGTAVSNMAPFVAKMVDGFVTLNEKTDGWLANILLAAGALKLVTSLIPGASAAAVAGGGAAGGAAAGGFFGNLLKFGVGGAALTYSGDLNANEAEELAKRRAMAPTIDAPKNSRSSQISDAEKAAGLPPGLIESVIKQETGGKQAYIDDPAKYHYEKNAEGKRIAGHTGKISTAFGPFGLLESTAKDPGYGVKPLQDKSFTEQLRFMSEYLAARIKRAGSIEKGLGGYGEGEKYAKQVLGRINYTPLSEGQIMSGISKSNKPGKTENTNITTGPITINTQATDAAGIARDLYPALVAQANSGMR